MIEHVDVLFKKKKKEERKKGKKVVVARSMLAYKESCLQLWLSWDIFLVFNKEMSGQPSLTCLGFTKGLGPGVPLELFSCRSCYG